MRSDVLPTDLAELGLLALGAFAPAVEDEVPDLAPGTACRTLVLVGNAGPDMWRAYTAQANGRCLDDWCRDGLTPLARTHDALAVFPWERPFRPFQRWLRRAGRTYASPIGIDIHPDYGLWWGLRGALAFAAPLDLDLPAAGDNPCETCAERPCLSACPVSAFGQEGYDVAACAAHLRAQAGADCMALACRARLACPIGRDYTQSPDQAAFHMRAFRAAHGT